MGMMEFSVFQIVDFAWVLELVILATSWVILCRGVRWGKETVRNALELLCLLTVLMASNLLTMMAGGMFILSWMLVHGTVAAVFMYFRSPYQPAVSLVMWCSMYAGICGLTSIAGQCSYLTGTFIASGPLEGVVRCLVYLLMIPLALYLRAFNFDNYRTVPRSGMLLILVGDLVILLLALVEMLVVFGGSIQVNICLLAAFAGMFVMVLVSIYALHAMCREQEEILDLQAERQRLQSERELANFTEASLEDLRCIRHDLKNQYAYMQILLDSERYADLKDYFRQRAANLPVQLTAIDCGNRAVNTILNMEITKAKNEGISVEHQLVVPPVLPFADDDLCAIVANLMDNAIEECMRLREQGREAVSLSIEIYPKRSYLFIVCHNTTDRQTLDRWQRGLRTTKKDPQLHGYGTRIVSKLSEKYNGCTEYSLENGRFTAMVMLDMMQKEEMP